MEPTTTTQALHGSCLCGGVRFEIAGDAPCFDEDDASLRK